MAKKLTNHHKTVTEPHSIQPGCCSIYQQFLDTARSMSGVRRVPFAILHFCILLPSCVKGRGDDPKRQRPQVEPRVEEVAISLNQRQLPYYYGYMRSKNSRKDSQTAYPTVSPAPTISPISNSSPPPFKAALKKGSYNGNGHRSGKWKANKDGKGMNFMMNWMKASYFTSTTTFAPTTSTPPNSDLMHGNGYAYEYGKGYHPRRSNKKKKMSMKGHSTLYPSTSAFPTLSPTTPSPTLRTYPSPTPTEKDNQAYGKIGNGYVSLLIFKLSVRSVRSVSISSPFPLIKCRFRGSRAKVEE
jgi:hypothetical protein